MKRLISTLLSLCIVGGVIPAIPQYAPESVVYAEYPINPQIPRSIDRNGFDECTEGILTYWVFPDFAIARSTFDGERPLAYGDIVIPSEYRGVPVTGVMLFEDCTELTSITLPDTVTQIAENTFLNCTSLENINIPKSVNRIYYNAFEGTPWLEKKRNESPMVIVNNILVDGKKCEGEVVIPDNVTRIDDRAFMDCQNIESVSIPESVKSIESGAFENCKSLASMTIPESVNSIGESAFKGTPWFESKQKDNPLVVVNGILIDGTACSVDVTIPDTVIVIGVGAFKDCSSLRSVVIPDSVKSICSSAFSNCTSLMSVSIPNSVTSMGDSAFETCINLKSIKIPDSVTSIGNDAFRSCSSLTSVNIPDSVKSIKRYTFRDCESLESITIHDSVTSIEEGAFVNCICLKSITIPESVISIGKSAFANCNSLTSVTIPKSVKIIEGYAFYNCPKLTSITILNPDCEIKGIYAFNRAAYASEVTAFNGTVYGYDGSTAQTYAEKYGYKFEMIPEYEEVVDGDLLYWVYPDHAAVRSNYEITDSGEYIIKTSGDIVIPSEFRGVPVTGVFGFGGAQELTSITLPDTITKIADNAFLDCTSLETINVPKSVNRVGYDAFVGTAWLENKLKESPLVILNGVLVDGHKCEGEVVIPDNVTRIADRAFMDCQSIESVSIPDSVEYIGRQAFYNTGWLNKLSAENELVIVNGFLLNGNNCGEKLVIPDTVKSINGQSFVGVDTLQSVTIPKSVKHIGLAAFYMCPELESVTILSPDCEIESYAAFSNGRREESGDLYFDGTIYGYAGSTAQTYAEKYGYKFESLGKAPSEELTTDPDGNTRGDANLDGNVNIADAVLVMQVATNPDKYAQGKSEYSITAQGEKNADVDGKAGLSNSDALLIQKFKLGLIKEF